MDKHAVAELISETVIILAISLVQIFLSRFYGSTS